MAWQGADKMFVCYRLLDFDVPFTMIRGSDNIFVAAVPPEELVRGRECEVSL